MPLADLKNFALDRATVSVWVFRKSGSKQPVFTGHWIDTSAELDAALMSAIDAARQAIAETRDYSLLAQNNEASALTLATFETNAGVVVERCMDETGPKKATKLRHLQNSAFYVVKVVSGDAVLHAFRRTDDSWKAKRALNVLTAVYADDQLTLDDRPGFNISKHFDFFVLGDEVFVSNKASFEVAMSYKQAHRDDFLGLQKEPDFLSAFTATDHLVDYVGENKIHLRRACAIKTKGHYKDPEFMESLRHSHAQFGLTINFSEDGRIVPTPETCQDIIRALLDHRLMSHFSKTIYDVEDAAAVK